MKFFVIAAAVILLSAGCKKDKNQNGPQSKQSYGPFSIYGEEVCNGSAALLVADYFSSHKIVDAVYDKSHENKEFYVRAASSEEFIVYVVQTYANDTTYWAWYEAADVSNCSFTSSGCGYMELQGFTNLDDITEQKFKFKFVFDNTNGTLIRSSKNKTLYYGEGKEKITGTCNRFASYFLADSAPCKEIFEGEKAWEYCFGSTWFFVK